MQIVQIHRTRHEVIAVAASCDYCQRPIENEDIESLWMVFAEPRDDQQKTEVVSTPLLSVHDGRCLNDWLYRESRQPDANSRLYGGWQLKDVGKDDTMVTTFDPTQAQPPTIALASVQEYVDAMIASQLVQEDK